MNAIFLNSFVNKQLSGRAWKVDRRSVAQAFSLLGKYFIDQPRFQARCHIARFFQIWSTPVGFQKVLGSFELIRNGEIFCMSNYHGYIQKKLSYVEKN